MAPGIIASLFVGALKVGDVAPDFTVLDTDNVKHTLSEMVKKGPVILAFFPKAFTSGWTRELTAYRSGYAEIEKAGGQVLAISADDAATQKKFKAELKATFPFVADAGAKLIELYDVKLPVLSMSNRTTFVINRERKIVSITSGSDAIDPTQAIGAAMTCGG